MKEIDTRGLSCPAPVLQTKAALQKDQPQSVQIVADNAADQENVQRFLASQGFQTALEINGDDYIVMGTCISRAGRRTESPAELKSDVKKIMVVCATDRIGFGDERLGIKLMVNFLRTLKEMGSDLWRLVFVSNGVKLTIEASEALDDLKAYEKDGLRILVCGTCLNHFNITEKMQVGEMTNSSTSLQPCNWPTR